ncbi:MAG: CCA tRNA nucleotidyltransferase [Dehalococcoidia bacterium]|nr:CCA tRNA nucleotidyltransferase [Dehalococcoidia bacterium]
MPATTDLLHRLRSTPTPAPARALDVTIAEARRVRVATYLVGGAVRDLLLGVPFLDIDIVVEGDAPALARAVGSALAIPVRGYRAFGTATIAGPDTGDSYQLDFATARTERYPRPGALPRVTPSILHDDLLRRDFTIHAMAFALDGPAAGQLIDPTGGQPDLANRLIRILHDRSFIDDPTRILRAARYSARLRFTLEPRTLTLARRDAPALATVSGARVRAELERLLAEPNPAAAFAAAADLGALEAITPHFRIDPSAASEAFRLWRTTIPEPERPHVGWAIVGSRLPLGVAAALAQRLSLPRRDAASLVGAATLAANAALTEASPSRVAHAVAPESPAAVRGAALAAPNEAIRRALSRYLTESPPLLHPLLSSADLIAAGVPRGPALSAIAALLLDARRDGLATTREDELALVRRALDTLRRGGTPGGDH